MAAAVADFSPAADPGPEVKKSDEGSAFDLSLKPTVDILKMLGRNSSRASCRVRARNG